MGMANSRRSGEAGGLSKSAIATSAIAPIRAAVSHGSSSLLRGAATEGRGALELVPESAPIANDRSRADWNRFAGFFSRQWRTMRSRPGGILNFAKGKLK